MFNQLNTNTEWLLCSLIHKFGSSDKTDTEAFIQDIKNRLPDDFSAKGEMFVFIDECHRTQSGRMHRAMKEILSDNATIVGFTGTPLMKKDKASSLETFGPYIHTYKYDEAVADKVILDLRYEANDALIETWRERVGLDVGDEAVLVFAVDERFNLLGTAGHGKFT